jgi:hypothetical protein
MQGEKVHCVKLAKTEGKRHRVGEIDVIIPRKPTKRKIVNNHKVKRNQKWERFELPKGFDWNASDDEYREQDVAFIEEDFERRMNGVWLMINGEPTWITGTHYYYLQWCKIDIGYPDYRDRDRRFFYHWEACVVDEKSYGMLMVKHRREGATYKGAALILEVMTRSFNSTGGIMSKTGADAKEFFHKLVKMFRSLPKFYQPIIAGTDNPKSMLEFDKPGERITKKSQKVKRSEALESKIEHKNTAENSFDSYKLKIIVPDEGGKWDDVDVRQHWRVLRPTLTQGRKVTGKAFYPSTVNEMSRKGGANFKDMFDNSDPNDRNLNDQTKTGLYRYFTPAYDGMEGFIDQFGASVIYTPEKPILGIDGQMIHIGAKEYLDNERAALVNDPEALAEFKRQFPYNIDEAFMVEVKHCAFNVEFLYSQYDWNSIHAPKILTPGDFIWTDGFGSPVKFIPSKRGKWVAAWVPDVEDQNKKTWRNGSTYPGNMDLIRSGVDPYDHDKTTDGKKSNAASYVFRMYNPVYEKESNMFVCQYIHRPPTAYIMYEDMLKQSLFYGCQILAENNKIGLVNWFVEKGYGNYLMKRPEITNTKYSARQKTPGIPTTGDNVRDSLIGVIEEYVYHFVGYNAEKDTIGLFYFNEGITDMLRFEVDNWTKYDATVAIGLTLLATKKHVKKPLDQNNKSRLVREYKVHHNKSILIKK